MKFFVGAAIFCTVLSLVSQSAESRDIHTRIVAGTPAAVGQLPWQVVLKKDAIDDVLCGASVISQIWVLTAAHCTYGLSSIYMVFGTISLDNEVNNQTSSQIFIHPQFNVEYLYNDVSLIQLSVPLVYSKIVQPIPLVPASSNSFLGTTAVVAGFGITDDENLEFSQDLQFAILQIIDNNQCKQVFGPEVVINSTMCAKAMNGGIESICSGDSGGPLIAKDADGNWMQIGINSFVAQDRCTEGFPSAFARLTSFEDYIQTITGLGALTNENDDEPTTSSTTTIS